MVSDAFCLNYQIAPDFQLMAAIVEGTKVNGGYYEAMEALKEAAKTHNAASSGTNLMAVLLRMQQK